MQRHVLYATITAGLMMLVAGCMSPEEAAEQRAQQIAEDEQTCISYGLRPGSESFGNCRLQLDLARQQRYNSYYDSPRIHTGLAYYHFH